jgi:FkbM family methyltransferase
MLSYLVSKLPASTIRFFGRLQFRFPILKSLINRISQYTVTEDGIIQRGVGKGLRFNAQGCNPGFLLGTSEPEEQQLLAKLLQPGDIFYDLGANAGFYAVLGAHLTGPNGKVYAFEPVPELAERIDYNAKLNNFRHIEVIQAAVCDLDGTVNFGIEESHIQSSIRRARENQGTDVQALTLDTWADVHPDPQVVMMDVEGAEIEALRGSLALIRRSRPFMMVEVHWLGETFVEFVEDAILPLGYQVTTYDGSPLPKGRRERYHALFTPLG